MGKYAFAPAGVEILRTSTARRCLEFIGSQQIGGGSTLAKGKRYLKSTLGCSGRAAKRAVTEDKKIRNHDYETYGLYVFYYHREFCARIVATIIDYIKNRSTEIEKMELFGFIPGNDREYFDLIYGYRESQLQWVEVTDYKQQRDIAHSILDDFNNIKR